MTCPSYDPGRAGPREGGPGGGSSPLAGRRSGKSFGQNPLVVAALDKLNRLLPWQRLPPLLGAVWLAGYREVQRAKNLYGTSAIPSRDPAQPAPPDPRVLQYRTSEGSYNDLSDPQMGMAGTRFGRNFPLHAVYPEPLPALLEPSPRAVSRQADDAGGLPAGHHPQPPRRRLDPVPDPRLV